MNKYEPIFHQEKLRQAQLRAMQECAQGPNELDRYMAALAAEGAKLSTPIMQDRPSAEAVHEKLKIKPHPFTEDTDAGMTPLATQVGGRHYKDMKIQPVEYIHANGIGYFEGNVIKYVSRWRQKGGVADLNKAKHYLELLIELEGKNI